MSNLKLRVKEMIIERLKLEGMTPDQIEDEAAGMKAFKSVQALTDFIAEHMKG